MPANVVTFDKMTVGSKGGGKHWTKAEVERRRMAAQGLQRKKAKPPKAPSWVKNDLQVYALWQQVIKNAKDLDLFDSLDANALATYCVLEVEKARAADAGDMKTFERLARTSLQYAKTLGLTPEARARIAKKRADADLGDPNADLFE